MAPWKARSTISDSYFPYLISLKPLSCCWKWRIPCCSWRTSLVALDVDCLLILNLNHFNDPRHIWRWNEIKWNESIDEKCLIIRGQGLLELYSGNRRISKKNSLSTTYTPLSWHLDSNSESQSQSRKARDRDSSPGSSKKCVCVCTALFALSLFEFRFTVGRGESVIHFLVVHYFGGHHWRTMYICKGPFIDYVRVPREGRGVGKISKHPYFGEGGIKRIVT